MVIFHSYVSLPEGNCCYELYHGILSVSLSLSFSHSPLQTASLPWPEANCAPLSRKTFPFTIITMYITMVYHYHVYYHVYDLCSSLPMTFPFMIMLIITSSILPGNFTDFTDCSFSQMLRFLST